MVFHNGFYI